MKANGLTCKPILILPLSLHLSFLPSLLFLPYCSSVHPGVISVQDPTVLDREVSPTVTLILTATDGGDNARAQTLTIVVNLDDINDNTPMFMPAEYTASVAEVSPALPPPSPPPSTCDTGYSNVTILLVCPGLQCWCVCYHGEC